MAILDCNIFHEIYYLHSSIHKNNVVYKLYIIIYLIITLLTYRPTADAALSQGKLHDCFLQEENLVTQLKYVLLQEYVPKLFPLGRDNGRERF